MMTYLITTILKLRSWERREIKNGKKKLEQLSDREREWESRSCVKVKKEEYILKVV